jgi:hypothetical protein
MHFHVLVPDGLFEKQGLFRPLLAPSDEDLGLRDKPLPEARSRAQPQPDFTKDA